MPPSARATPPTHTTQRVPNRSSKLMDRGVEAGAALTAGSEGGDDGSGGGAAGRSGGALSGIAAASALGAALTSVGGAGVAVGTDGAGCAGAGPAAAARGSEPCARANSSARSRASIRRMAPNCDNATTKAAMAVSGIANAAKSSM